MSGSIVTLAIVTMLLYLSLAAACSYYLFKYREIQRTPALVGYYDEPKMLFFLVLLVAALLDVPLYISCAVLGGPKECEWGPPPANGEDGVYALCWCMHLIASCGYVYATLTPAVLWNDIIAPTFSYGITSSCEYRDGLLLFSATPVDATKLFFRGAFLLYCAVQMMSVVVEITATSSHGTAATSSDSAIEFGNCLEPVLIVFITAGCLWCALRLQYYVMRVQLGSAAERKVLVQLNYTLAIIVVSYLLRAILVLSLFDGIPEFVYLVPSPAGSYAMWLFGTRWMPNIFCSFFLLRAMRFSAMKGGDMNSSRSDTGTNGGRGKKQPLLRDTESESDQLIDMPRGLSEGTAISRGGGSVRSTSFGFFSEHRGEFFTDDGDFFRRVQQNSVDFSSSTSPLYNQPHQL